jgi:hypothetical protein
LFQLNFASLCAKNSAALYLRNHCFPTKGEKENEKGERKKTKKGRRNTDFYYFKYKTHAANTMAIELDDDDEDKDVLHAIFALELEVDDCEDDDDVSRIRSRLKADIWHD